MTKFIVGLATVAAAASSFAVETLTYEGGGAGHQITIGGTHHVGDVWAGKLRFNSTSLGHIQTLCVDLDHFISNGQVFEVQILDSNVLGPNLEQAGNIISHGFALANTDEKAAALQIAVWEAVYDNAISADFSNGNFTVTGGADAGTLADAATFYAFRTASGNSKYFKPTQDGQGQMTPVPEPTTMLGLAIGALALRRRKKA